MNSLEMAYEEGVKLAMVECGLIKEAGPTQDLLEAAHRVLVGSAPAVREPAAATLRSRLMNLLRGAGSRTWDVAKMPMVHRGAGGAVAGGLLGGLTGDEEDALARILAGGAIGGGLGVGSVPAERLIKKLVASGRIGKAFRGMGREMESRARAAGPTPQELLAVAD